MEINFYGIVGFIGFEALKIYRKNEKGEPLFYNKQYFVYILTLIVLSLFSGVLAQAFAKDNISEAIFIGFSVPTNIKVVFANNSSKDDDIDHSKPKGIIGYLKYIYLVYFKF